MPQFFNAIALRHWCRRFGYLGMFTVALIALTATVAISQGGGGGGGWWWRRWRR